MDQEMMKIAFLNIYQQKNIRGVETYINEISDRLSHDFKIDIISEVNYLKLLLGRYDVIISTNGRFQALIVRFISWLIGAKMIVPGQSGPGADDKWNLLCLPDLFIALTKPQETWAKKFNPLVKVVTIPNGVDLAKFNSKNKAVKVSLPSPVILNVGALEQIKRQDLLIKAVAKTHASLLLVGKGSKENYLRHLGEKLLPGRFQIASFPHKDMPHVYPACDLFSYPTVPWESFGIVMVEAMASGLPVVASDDPIRREIVEDAGLFVNPTNTDEYANVLQKALNTKWGTKPRHQAEKFSWDEIAQKYKKLFLQLVQ